MKLSPEEELDLLIDSLNTEQKPQHNLHPESAGLLAVVRAVKSIRPQKEASENLGSRIFSSINKQNRRPWRLVPAAALIASLLLFAVFTTTTGSNNVVSAMEKAVGSLANYHGTLEVREENASGDESIIRRVELWSEGKKYAALDNKGILTVNDGSRRWQVRPENKEVALLPPAPDPAWQGFDFHAETDRALKYPHTVIGQDVAAGRQATKLKISPPGGLPYYLWIDGETDLPLQLQTAMQNALQTTYTFTEFEPNTVIDSKIFAYQPPQGYKITEITPDPALPDTGNDLAAKAKIAVPVDIDIAKADQQQVDGGHSPWQLSPLAVSLTFVNLKVSPEGITGEPEIPESSFKVKVNDGTEAVVEVSSGPVSKVYLKRLVRQDETGIWSVTGFDPR